MSDSSDDDLFGFNRRTIPTKGGRFSGGLNVNRPSALTRPSFQITRHKKKKKGDIWGDSSSDEGYGSAGSAGSASSGSSGAGSKHGSSKHGSGSSSDSDDYKSPRSLSPVQKVKNELAAKGVSQPPSGDLFSVQQVGSTDTADSSSQKKTSISQVASKSEEQSLAEEHAAFYNKIAEEVFTQELQRYADLMPFDTPDREAWLTDVTKRLSAEFRESKGSAYDRYIQRIADVDDELLNAKVAKLDVSKKTGPTASDPAQSDEELDERLKVLHGKIPEPTQQDIAALEAARQAARDRIRSNRWEAKHKELTDQSVVMQKLERLVAREGRSAEITVEQMKPNIDSLHTEFIAEIQELYMQAMHNDQSTQWNNDERWMSFLSHAEQMWDGNLQKWVGETKTKAYLFQTPHKPISSSSLTPDTVLHIPQPPNASAPIERLLSAVSARNRSLKASPVASRSATSKATPVRTSMGMGDAGAQQRIHERLSLFSNLSDNEEVLHPRSELRKGASASSGKARSQTNKSTSSGSKRTTAQSDEEDEEQQGTDDEEPELEPEPEDKELTESELKALSKMDTPELMKQSKKLKASGKLSTSAKITILQEFDRAAKKATGGDGSFSAFRLQADGTITPHGQGKVTYFIAHGRIKKQIAKLKGRSK